MANIGTLTQANGTSVINTILTEEAKDHILGYTIGNDVTITTSWPPSARFTAQGQPQKPSPPRTRTFTPELLLNERSLRQGKLLQGFS